MDRHGAARADRRARRAAQLANEAWIDALEAKSPHRASWLRRRWIEGNTIDLEARINQRYPKGWGQYLEVRAGMRLTRAFWRLLKRLIGGA